jgi:hypothetical protein
VLKAQVAFAESAGKDIINVGESLFQAVDTIAQAAGNAGTNLSTPEGDQEAID